jgi:hypothetical protein
MRGLWQAAIVVMLSPVAFTAQAQKDTCPQKTITPPVASDCSQQDSDNSPAAKESTESPGNESSETPDTLMKVLAAHGKHNFENESWNLYAQYTYISHWKQASPRFIPT